VKRLAEPVALAGLVAAQALLFGRLVGTDTDFDEGVYLTSLDALEHGQRLGEDVFAPQPPGWYLLLRLLSLAGADSVRGFHIGMVVVAIATCVAAYGLGRTIAGPWAGLTASAMLTVAPPFPLYAHRLLADIPPLGLALLAFLLAWEARERSSIVLALAAGGAIALTFTLKPTAAIAVPTFLLLLLLSRQRSFGARTLVGALAGAAVVTAGFLVAYRGVLGELWGSIVTYHRDARDTPAVIDKTHELVTFLNFRTPFAWLVVAGAFASFWLARSRAAPAVWALWLWAAVSVAFLVYHQPLHENHLLLLPVVLAVPAGIALAVAGARSRSPALAAGLLALALGAGYVQQQRRVSLDQVDEEPALVAAAEILQRIVGPDELVVSDHSIVPFLADRRVPGALVDTAALRFQTGSLTSREVLRELDLNRVHAVVVGRAFADQPELLRGLSSRYSTVPAPLGLRIYVRR